MKFKVLAWFLCVLFNIRLISCKKVELRCVENSKALIKLNLYGCDPSNTCILSDVVAEKGDKFHFEQGDKNCIVFLNSSLYTIPSKLSSDNLRTIYAANSSLRVLSEMKFEKMYDLIFKDNRMKYLPDSLKISSCVIDFSNNQISTIEDNLFLRFDIIYSYNWDGQPNSKPCKITFSNNQLEVLPLEVFSDHGFFEEHDFSGNLIKEVEDSSTNMFYQSSTSFNFSKNMFKSIPVNLLMQYGVFNNLDLSYNQIEATNTSDPDSLVQRNVVTFLNLSFNNIREFSFNFLKYFQIITKLDASNNQIECFDNTDYLLNSQIEEINLNNNKIRIMPVTLFSQIKNWDLSFNLIEMFSDYDDTSKSEHIFVNSINMSFNNLESLPLKAFSLFKIRSLILSNNRINTFRDFATLLVTEVLDLSNNSIWNIPFETFADSDLKSLILNNNKIQLKFSIFPKNIEIIDLRFNQLRTSDFKLFSYYKNLHTIYLDNNDHLILNTEDLLYSNIKRIGISSNIYTCYDLLKLLMILKKANIEYVINNPLVKNFQHINGIGCNN